MKSLKAFLIILIALCEFDHVSAQNAFHGNFQMNFKSSKGEPEYPFKWNIEKKSPEPRMALQIVDEMTNQGVIKRVIYNFKDSTWTITIGYNMIKQGTRIHANSMFRDSVFKEKISVRHTNEKRKIENYTCKKLIVESSNHIAEVWYTDKLKLDVCRIYLLLSHSAMLAKNVRSGDWYKSKEIPGMIVEVTNVKKSTGDSYTVNITDIKPGLENAELYNLSGYTIADIPEGENCGMVTEE